MSSLLFGNGTDVVHWKPSPKTRGTNDILSTCIITMLLCVWTAVHLNVPPPGSIWEHRLRKVGWLVLALLAPEMVAYTAWYQRRRALSVAQWVNKTYNLPNPLSGRQRLTEGVRKSVRWAKKVFIPSQHKPARQPTLEAQKSSSVEDRHPWTLVHGFYVLMGGFAFETPESPPKSKAFLPSHRKETWFLDEYFWKGRLKRDSGRNILPDLSEEEIKSKSKANGLTKGLVCIQALWFIAQCITRLAQRIPISLLELNTFGHAVCALLIYLLWWEKPFEVDYPTILKDQILMDFYALRWMRKNRSPAIELYYNNLTVYLEEDGWFQTLLPEIKKNFLIRLQRRSEDGFFLYLDYLQTTGDNEAHPTQDMTNNTGNEAASTILTFGQTLKGTGFKARALRDIISDFRPMLEKSFDSYSRSHQPLPDISLTAEEVTRSRMAWRALKELGLDILQFRHWREFGHYFHVVQRCEDWPDIYEVFEPPVALGFSTAALVYGGLHALAWFAHFDSSTQQLLWRISVCAVMGGFPVFFALDWVIEFIDNSFDIPDASFLLLAISMGLFIPTYVLARAYLVVECFIDLSHLPAGVYDVPTWSTYFPHIS